MAHVVLPPAAILTFALSAHNDGGATKIGLSMSDERSELNTYIHTQEKRFLRREETLLWLADTREKIKNSCYSLFS